MGFNPESVKVEKEDVQVEESTISLEKLRLRKPNRNEFFRSCPHDKIPGLVELTVKICRFEDDVYVVEKEMIPVLEKENLRLVRLVLCQNQKEQHFLWPVTERGGRFGNNSWHKSAREIEVQSRERWVRMRPDYDRKCYEAVYPSIDHPDPEWPDISFEELCNLVPDEQVIKDENHYVVRSLRGETY